MFLRTLGAASLAILLSGCVWFPFGEELNDTDAMPSISFLLDQETGRIGIQAASSQADWNRLAFEVRGCDSTKPGPVTIYAGAGASNYIRHNVDASASGAPLTALDQASGCGAPLRRGVAEAPAPINAGDFVALCARPRVADASVENVKVYGFDVAANAVVVSVTFERLPPCPA